MSSTGLKIIYYINTICNYINTHSKTIKTVIVYMLYLSISRHHSLKPMGTTTMYKYAICMWFKWITRSNSDMFNWARWQRRVIERGVTRCLYFTKLSSQDRSRNLNFIQQFSCYPSSTTRFFQSNLQGQYFRQFNTCQQIHTTIS